MIRVLVIVKNFNNIEMSTQLTASLNNLSLKSKPSIRCETCEALHRQCKDCKYIKNAEYARSDRGSLIKQHSAVKMRFFRRAKRIKDIAALLVEDLNILNATDIDDDDIKELLSILNNTSSTLCLQDMQRFKAY